MTTESMAQSRKLGFLREPSDRVFLGVLALIAACFFLASCLLVSDDVFLFSIIGKAIYEKGLMPFTYIFDHKPVFTYYLYGLFALFAPDDAPKYQIISVIGFALSAFLTRAFVRRDAWWVHFLVITGLSIHFLRFSANTELFFSALAMVSILLVLRSRTLGGIFFAGVFAAMSFNMNYLAVFSIGPAVLYAMCSGQGSVKRRLGQFAVYGVGFVAAFALILLPLVLKGVDLGRDYFGIQQRFLSAYGSQPGRPFLFFLAALLPLAGLAVVSLPCADADRRIRNTIVLATVFAFLGSVSSGKYFSYYVYPVVLPLTILWSISTYAHKRLAVLCAIVLLACLSVPVYVKNAVRPNQVYSDQLKSVRSMAGDEKVLSVRAHPSITYLAHIEPSQPFLWPNHAYLLFGPKEDDYFVGQLEKKPKFVLTLMSLCGGPASALPMSCKLIQDGYSNVLTIDNVDSVRRAYLYKLNER